MISLGNAPQTAQSGPAPNERASRTTRALDNARHDAGLVLRFKAGDEGAFVEIVSRYRTRMTAVAYAMIRNHADAEEIAQDTFIRAHRGLAQFRGEASLVNWLHRVTLNLARNRYWYFYRRRRHLTLSFESSVGGDNPRTIADIVPSDTASPAQAALLNELSEHIGRCFERLGSAEQEILNLRNVRDHSYAEIALERGLKVGTVKSRIARARETLRGLIAKERSDFRGDERPWRTGPPVLAELVA